MQSTYNPYRKWVFLFGLFVPLGLAIALVSLLGKGLFDGAFAIGGTIFLFGPILLYVSWKMYKEVDDLLKGRTTVAHWQYSPDEWARYAASENAKQDKSKSSGWFGSVLSMLAVGGIIYYMLFGARFELSFLPFFLGIAIIALALIGYQQWQQNQESSVNAGQPSDVPQACISTKGVWINKRYFSFAGQTSFNISYEQGDPPVIQFNWETRGTSRSAAGVRLHKLRLPVPRNQATEVDRVLHHFGYKS